MEQQVTPLAQVGVREESNIFKPRVNIKPYEYPELYDYIPAIRNSYWIHTEYNYTSDIHDLKVGLTEKEKSVLVNAVLAISQIENQVKEFWGKIGNRLPKPEIKIYSPNKNTLHIVGIESGIVNFKLYDILGKELIKTSFVGNGLNKIPMQNFEKGMYIIKLQTNNVFVSKKVILK